jgi:hypothetical protein
MVAGQNCSISEEMAVSRGPKAVRIDGDQPAPGVGPVPAGPRGNS